ncbi:MAG TPA: YraN family protein [Thiotrichaceae bacterium]|jgi:putative endonuclease|nr:YraN family protein [Thiotrichaceae bacterium]HIM07178.1 YraN family protein [Gammaproteobacteria bacterium]
MKTTKPANQSGKIAENIAAKYLAKHKVKLLTQNFHSRFGEIDLIALEQEILLFVEVRYRKNENYLAIVETIDRHKCKKILTTSEYYLSKNKKYQSYQCRYDVITITGVLDKPVIEWIKNAFQA